MDWFAHAVACSLYALGFGAYFREVLLVAGVREFDLPIFGPEVWLAVAACTLFSYINFRGASETGKAGNVVTLGKLAIIGAFIVAGLWTMARHTGWQASFSPFMREGWGGVLAAMGLTFIAFEGYEIIAQTSEEVEDPKRNIPRAVFVSLLIVIPIYLLVAVVAIGAVIPPAGMSVTQYLGAEKETALVSAADQFVLGGGLIVLVGGLLSTLSALNATIYSSSRVALAMARDASLPPIVARIHPGRATPHVAILLSAILVIGMAVSLPIEEVAAAASVMFLLLFGGVNVALIRLRRQQPDLDRGFRVPFVPYVPVLAMLAMLFIAVFMFIGYPLAWLAAGSWIVLGLGAYYAYSKTREKALVEREIWMERIDRKEYRVLVAISSLRTVESLVEVASAIAKKHDGEIVALTVAEVPEGQPLLTGRRRARELEPILDEAVRLAEQRGVRVQPVAKIAHRISHAIVQTAREEECNFLIIGSAYQQSFFERIVASIVERVLNDAPCRVGVVYGEIDGDAVRRIVLPVTDTRNAKLAAQLVPAFADRFAVPVEALTVVAEDTPASSADAMVEGARETVRAADLGVQLQVLRRVEPVAGLLGEIKRGDLVILGAPSHGLVTPIFGETIPLEIAKREHNPVIVVRDFDQRVRRFERVFFRRS